LDRRYRTHLVFLRSVRLLLVTASIVPSSPILVTLMKEALSSSKRRFLQELHGVTSQKTSFFIYFGLETLDFNERVIKACIREINNFNLVRFEVFTAVTMKNGVFWVVTPHGVTTQKTPFFNFNLSCFLLLLQSKYLILLVYVLDYVRLSCKCSMNMSSDASQQLLQVLTSACSCVLAVLTSVVCKSFIYIMFVTNYQLRDILKILYLSTSVLFWVP
jgi:hypothetical protein